MKLLDRLWIGTLFITVSTGIAMAKDSVFSSILVICAITLNNILKDRYER